LAERVPLPGLSRENPAEASIPELQMNQLDPFNLLDPLNLLTHLFGFRASPKGRHK
jgi:hypothetical protein